MSATHIKERVQKHRDSRRTAGLRLVQIWVPDTRRPDFTEECRRQSERVTQADMGDTTMQQIMQSSLDDLEGWTA